MLLELAEKNDKVLSWPGPTALTLSYDDFSITYGLKCFVKDFEDVIDLGDEILTAIYSVSKQKGFTIPFPRQEVEVTMNKGD